MILEPVSPFFATTGLIQFAQTLVDMLAGVGLRKLVSEPLLTSINGYVFVDMHLCFRPWHILGILRDVLMYADSMKGQEQELALYRQRVAALAVDDISVLSCAGLLARLEDLMNAGMQYWLQIMEVVQPIYRVERLLIQLYDKSIRQVRDPEPEILLRG